MKVVKGEFYKYINAKHWGSSLIAVSRAGQEVAYRIQQNGGDKKNLPITWLAEDLIDWVAGGREPKKEWILAIFKHYGERPYLSTCMLIEPDSDKNTIVIETCSEWITKMRYSFQKVRENRFFATISAPKELKELAECYYTERTLSLLGITENYFTQLISYGYMIGVRAGRKKGRSTLTEKSFNYILG